MSKSKAIFWPRARRLAWALAALVASGAATAGGHLDVDDSATLDPGQCQYEAWVGRTGIEPIKVWHLGPACRMARQSVKSYAILSKPQPMSGSEIHPAAKSAPLSVGLRAAARLLGTAVKLAAALRSAGVTTAIT